MKPRATEFRKFAAHLAQVAAAAMRDTGWASVEIKQDGSPVTQIDRLVEQQLRTEITASFPDHGIIGKEYGPERENKDWIWMLAPIDGKRQFAAGLPTFGTLIALCYEYTPVLGVIAHPQLGMTCVGITGEGTEINGKAVRCQDTTVLNRVIACISDPDAFDPATQAGYEAVRAASLWNVYDGGCMGYAALAQGRLGLALNGPNLEPFDIAALIPVIEGAGGVISDWRGLPLDARSGGAIVASANEKLHDQVLSLLNF